MDDEAPSECIYNLLPRPQPPPRQRLNYRSKQRNIVQKDWDSKKSAHKTMGLPKVEPPCPKHHLLKHSKEQKLPERKPYKVPVEGIKSSIPSDKPLMGLRTKKNFVQANVFDVQMAVPKKPVPIIVDTRKGNKILLEPSGLLPTLLYRKDFGKIPDYLIKQSEEEKKAQEEYDAYVKERIRQGSMKMLTEEERNSVLSGLKRNWAELNHAYQSLSILIDTHSKQMHKEVLETKMKKLEQDIDMFEKHKFIYIPRN
ncbi:enkurin [Hemiscyllium ocellatum]|uniref:enkurin n=1 Tax=Hemiscyllium ocellatum TaxID=170820 RepID=UPI002966162E|nr:enkurin [Hemiscyllium ocellatum]